MSTAKRHVRLMADAVYQLELAKRALQHIAQFDSQELAHAVATRALDELDELERQIEAERT